MFHSIDSWFARNGLFILIMFALLGIGEILRAIHALEEKINSLQDTVDSLNDSDLDSHLAAAKDRLEMEKYLEAEGLN